VIEAAILAGGLGTRLRQVVGDRPKSLAPVAGRPFLCHILDQVAAAGVHKAVLCTGYLGDQLQDAIGEGYGSLSLSYSREATARGTAGALRLALPLLNGDPVLVLNGDSYCDVSLSHLIDWQQRRGAPSAGSLLLTWVEDAARYGTVQIDDEGAVIAFREKSGRAAPGWINAGVYVLSRRLLASIPARGATSLEHDVFPAWIGRGLDGCQIAAPFIDIGTPESYARAGEVFAECQEDHRHRVPRH
jgi:NDP-sugar pyrophosphorylase family protein